jgi:hypothetical protein
MIGNEGLLSEFGQVLGEESGLTARDARLLGKIPDEDDFDLEIQVLGQKSAAYLISSKPDAKYWGMVSLMWRGWGKSPYLVNMSGGRPGNTGTGLGARLAFVQARTAQLLGVERILTTGAGEKGSWMNGYYTWPRLGFDGRIGDGPWRKIPPELKEVAGKERSVLKLCGHEFGRNWWRDNGKTIDLFFDLRGDSLNWEFMRAYMKEREERHGKS